MNRRDFVRQSALGAAAFVGLNSLVATAACAAESELALSTESLNFEATDGLALLVEPQAHRVGLRRVDGTFVWRYAKSGAGALELNGPQAAVFDAGSGWSYVANHGNANVLAFSPDGQPVALGHKVQLGGARDVVLDQGQLYVCDSLNHRIQVMNTQGELLRTIGQFGRDGQGLNGPASLTIDPYGRLHVADRGGQRIQIYSLDGQWLGQYGHQQGLNPRSISADEWGQVHVADAIQAEIFSFAPDGHLVARSRRLQQQGRQLVPLALHANRSGLQVLAA